MASTMSGDKFSRRIRWAIGISLLSLLPLIGLGRMRFFQAEPPSKVTILSFPTYTEALCPFPKGSPIERRWKDYCFGMLAWKKIERGEKLTSEEIEKLFLLAGDPEPIILDLGLGALRDSFVPAMKDRLLPLGLKALGSKDELTQICGIHMVGKCSAKEHAKAVVPFLRSPNKNVRRAAVRALEKLRYSTSSEAAKHSGSN